jgi:vanillate O-demethylase ferredoxin subunit
LVTEPGAKFVGFTVIAQRLEALMPGAQETYIPLPKKGLVASYAIAADAPYATARSYAWFDGGSARLLRLQPFAEAPAGFRLYYWMMAFHTAALGGWPVKIVLLLAVFSVPVLAYTGTASYLRRKFRAKTPPAAVRVAEVPAMAAK